MSEQKIALKLIHMEDVQTREVNWLWYPYIPYGKITVIEGDPGEGKTTLALTLAALLSRGQPLPCDEDIPYEPISIIYQTAEDGIDDTIKPRLLIGHMNMNKASGSKSTYRGLGSIDIQISVLWHKINQVLRRQEIPLVLKYQRTEDLSVSVHMILQ